MNKNLTMGLEEEFFGVLSEPENFTVSFLVGFSTSRMTH